MAILQRNRRARTGRGLNSLPLVMFRHLQNMVGRSFRDSFAGCDLTQTQVMILAAIAEHGAIRQAALPDMLGVCNAHLVDPIDSMVRGGLVFRAPNPDDRRSNQLTLTDQGRRVAGEVSGMHLQMADDLIGWMTPSERRHFMSVLNRVARRNEIRTQGRERPMMEGEGRLNRQ